ncbi:hypothetical protein [Ktedonobacter sp. SOSP1-52]|uniref:hypothetical protein n=1 Tax=Ktedonobacter sp. SOSP1-52 TaxID=2778366 RepID=UPI001915057B|nr:hypothetical protein [Ktedonobacter sp. SOSP1-52]
MSQESTNICPHCQAANPPGQSHCVRCGAAHATNSVPPTVLATGSSPQHNALPPTVQASAPNASLTPPPPTPVSNPYHSGAAYNPYGNAGTPPPSSNAYGQPPYAPPPQVPYGQPMMAPVVAQPRKQSGSAIAAIIILAVLLVLTCGFSGIYIAVQNNKTATMNKDATATADDATATAGNATATAYAVQLTPTPYPPYTESESPSGATFSEAAQQVIPTAQLANEIDSQQRPITLQSKFQSGQTIYLSYKWAQGNTGYVQTRWYVNGEMKDEVMSKYINEYANGYGYFSESLSPYDVTFQGTVEVFWCQDANCTHGGLAWARPFSVTAS